MFKHYRFVTTFFIFLLSGGIVCYFVFSPSVAIGKGESQGVLTQITALVTAITGLLGTITTCYISIRKDRREQCAYEESREHFKQQ
jgi:Na+/melibiose symporter-like transporter